MAHLTSFEIALVVVAIPFLVVGTINFIQNISLKHYKDDKLWKLD